MPPSVEIPLDLLAPALDTPSEFSRQASFLTPHWVSLTLVLEGDRQTRPTASLRSLEIFMVAGTCLTLQWKEELWRFVFLPVGGAFLRRSRCGTAPFAESVSSCQGEKEDR